MFTSARPGAHALPLSRTGFTLVELVATLAIASILLGVAVPSFVTIVKDAALRELIVPSNRALLIARSEATRSRSDVTVCPRASDTACGTDWDNGLLVFVDGLIVRDEATAVRDPDDRVLMVVPAHGSDNSLTAIASTDRTANTAYAPNYVRYGPDGRTDWRNGSLIACDTRGKAHSRALNVTLTGGVEEARPATKGGVALDVFNREIPCS